MSAFDMSYMPEINNSHLGAVKKALEKQGYNLGELQTMPFNKLMEIYDKMDKKELPQEVVAFVDRVKTNDQFIQKLFSERYGMTF
ncbi:MAG: hypothetical protein PHV30_01430 [Candidatus Margulisbacteria bacterium]|nr:hypothetical protein [Candidatus Margulisiibacteriota bacterium]